MTELLDLLIAAAGYARNLRDEVQWLADEGLLELVVERDPDGFFYAEFAHADRLKCWDGCNGITRTHRGGWCPFIAEHADRDCGCGESYYDDELPVEVTHPRLTATLTRPTVFEDDELF